jgi:hypothetical protein
MISHASRPVLQNKKASRMGGKGVYQNMGFRFRKSMKILPGVRLNLNAKSASVSFGPRGLKHTISTTGRRTTTVGIPGSGISYSSSSSSRQTSGDAGHMSDQYIERDPAAVSPKSKTVTLLLCIFLGYFGVHRFYVGKKGTGLLWALSAGVFGIGWIADIITIALGWFWDAQKLPIKK